MAIQRDPTDIRKDLIRNIGNVYPNPTYKASDVPVLNNICSTMSCSYRELYGMTKTITGPIMYYKNQIRKGLNRASLDTLKRINKDLNALMANLPNVLLPKYFDPKFARMIEMFGSQCIDFKTLFNPTVMASANVNVQKAKNVLNKGRAQSSTAASVSNSAEDDFLGKVVVNPTAMSSLEDPIKLPKELENNVKNQVTRYKNNAVDEVFGGNKDLVVNIRSYEGLIKDLDVPNTLKTLRKMEKCLSNPQMCGKTKKDLIGSNVGKPMSAELSEAFSVDSAGKIKIKEVCAGADPAKLKEFLSIKRKIDIISYGDPPKKPYTVPVTTTARPVRYWRDYTGYFTINTISGTGAHQDSGNFHFSPSLTTDQLVLNAASGDWSSPVLANFQPTHIRISGESESLGQYEDLGGFIILNATGNIIFSAGLPDRPAISWNTEIPISYGSQMTQLVILKNPIAGSIGFTVTKIEFFTY